MTQPVDRARVTTIFGWVAGGSLGLLVSYGLFLAFAASYPATPGTFALFLAGTFGGMHVADRLGPRGFAPLGVAAGVFLVAFLSVLVAGMLSS